MRLQLLFGVLLLTGRYLCFICYSSFLYSFYLFFSLSHTHIYIYIYIYIYIHTYTHTISVIAVFVECFMCQLKGFSLIIVFLLKVMSQLYVLVFISISLNKALIESEGINPMPICHSIQEVISCGMFIRMSIVYIHTWNDH